MSNYGFLNTNQTPQTEKILGREAEMTNNVAGGVGFVTDLPTKIRRALYFGTTEQTYYSTREELTKDFFDACRELAQQNPKELADLIMEAGCGRAYKMAAPIMATLLLSSAKNTNAKKEFLRIFPEIIRTGSHLLEFVAYCRNMKALRSTGKIVKRAIWNWFDKKSPDSVAYQLLKYRSRTTGQKISQRDVLRLFHVKPGQHQEVFHWVTKGWDAVPEKSPSDAVKQIWWYEYLCKNPTTANAIEAIIQGNLPHEALTMIVDADKKSIMTPVVWKTLLTGQAADGRMAKGHMPLTAMLRSLRHLTKSGVISFNDTKTLDFIESIFTDKKKLQDAKIHPLALLIAYAGYTRAHECRGARKGGLEKYEPVPRIANILERSMELAWQFVGATDKRIFLALDVSGSMSGNISDTVPVRLCEVAAALALQVVKKERNYFIGGFSDYFKPLKFFSSMSIANASAEILQNNFGATDAAVGYRFAMRNKIEVDTFINLTDNCTWAGNQHPSQALAEYRQSINKNAKAIYITLAPHGETTLVDPRDPCSWDFIGFDANLFNAIQDVVTEVIK